MSVEYIAINDVCEITQYWKEEYGYTIDVNYSGKEYSLLYVTGKDLDTLLEENEKLYVSAVKEGYLWFVNSITEVLIIPNDDMAKIRIMLSTIKDEDYRKLADSFLEDNELLARFRSYPGSVSRHHAYAQGLLKHTEKVMELAFQYCNHYECVVNRDALLITAFLHDIGKVVTCDSRNKSYEITWHVEETVNLVRDKVIQTGFPDDKWKFLRVILWSQHRGQKHVLPESKILSLLDSLDAHADMVKNNKRIG